MTLAAEDYYVQRSESVSPVKEKKTDKAAKAVHCATRDTQGSKYDISSAAAVK